MNYETVIGLEVHVQLKTQTKAFCGCKTTFGAPPNAHTCPVCLGLPGSLPVFNRLAFELGLRTALALDCQIAAFIKFDRKHYFYPDLPKNFQISQYDRPLSHQGYLEITVEGTAKRIGITRVHLEEDAGKLIHEQAGGSLVDFNRAGVPLMEIVSEPDLRGPDEAYAYLQTLKAVLEYLEVSDCDMEKGSLRCDTNISLRPAGQQPLGSKVEIKNLNSFKAVKAALIYEQQRQSGVLAGGGTIPQETRLWDDERQITLPMRSKEEAHDYRYFPEPDLVPFHVEPSEIDRVRRALPELPAQRRQRFMSQYGLPAYDAGVLTSDKALAELFEVAVRRFPQPKAVANWVMGEFLGYLNTRGTLMTATGLTGERLAELLSLVARGTLSGKMAKEVFAEMLASHRGAEAVIHERGLSQIADAQALTQVADEVLAANAGSVAAYRAGKTTVLTFLIGQCMKATKGQAHPQQMRQILEARLRATQAH